MTPEEIENLRRPITSEDIESVIKYLSTKKSLAGQLYQTFKAKLTPQTLLKTEYMGTLPSSFYEAITTLITVKQ